jgi:Protein of unknown function (DUF3140)
MTANELEDFLGTDDSKSVGDKGSGGESTGHQSGRRIMKILRAKKGDLTRGRRRPHAQGRGLRAPWWVIRSCPAGGILP